MSVIVRYIGIDVHKDMAYVHALDQHGNKLFRTRLRMELQFDAFAETLGPQDHVALEATTHAFTLHDVLAEHAGEVVVVNPIKTALIAKARVKTDKLDARILAELMRCGFIYAVWVPPMKIRQLRSLVGQRIGRNKDRTRVKNAIHALLRTYRLTPPVKDPFTQRGRVWLQRVELEPLARFQMDQHLQLLDAIENNIRALEGEIARLAADNPMVKRIMQVTGLSYYTALAVYAEIGDIERFPSAKQLASYVGIVPSVDQSGDHCYYGRITKAGRKRLRWILIEAAHTAVKHDASLSRFYHRIAYKKGKNVAKVAVARKLVVRLWYMWHEDENLRTLNKGLWTRKLQQLAWKVGSQHRAGSVQEFIAATASELGVPLTPDQARGRKRGRKKETSAPAPGTESAPAQNATPTTKEAADRNIVRHGELWVDAVTGEIITDAPPATHTPVIP